MYLFKNIERNSSAVTGTGVCCLQFTQDAEYAPMLLRIQLVIICFAFSVLNMGNNIFA